MFRALRELTSGPSSAETGKRGFARIATAEIKPPMSVPETGFPLVILSS